MVVRTKIADGSMHEMSEEREGSRSTQGKVAVKAKTLYGGRFSRGNASPSVDYGDERREPYPTYEEDARSSSNRHSYSLSEEADANEIKGASVELAYKLKQRRDSSTSLHENRDATSGERHDQWEESNAPYMINQRWANTIINQMVSIEPTREAPARPYSYARTSEAYSYQEPVEPYEERASVDVHSIISNHRYHDSMKASNGSRHKVLSGPMHRSIPLSVSKARRRENQISSTSMAVVNTQAASKEFNRQEVEEFCDESTSEYSLNDTINDTSNKLDAALSMMEEYRRMDAERKIMSMMEVREDDRLSKLPTSKIDWETGECDHTPWVGQVGINDELFEDEPLEYAEGGKNTKQHERFSSFCKETWSGLPVRRKLIVFAAGMLLIAGVFGWGAMYVHRRRTATCTLCYGGFVPNDMKSSMVGGQTCADFRTSAESLKAREPECLQSQSLAWLMCACPSLPPFPKKPSCTLCGEGVILKGTACNHINTFMAHISDQDYCEALKSSVSKAGCGCPDE